MATESMMKQLPAQMVEPKWYAEMGNAFQTYGIYFLVIFIFVIIVFFTSHKYSKACSEAIRNNNNEYQKTWKWINYGAWFFGCVLSLIATTYWMWSQNKSKRYSYMINFECQQPNIRIDSTQYYKRESMRAATSIQAPGAMLESIYSSSFIIVKTEPFCDGEKFVFNIVTPVLNQQQVANMNIQPREIIFKKEDCKDTICMANYQVVNDRFEKIASISNNNFTTVALNQYSKNIKGD